MYRTVFRTADVPAEERFGAFRELADRMHAPMDVASDHSADFRAELHAIEIGQVRLWPTVVSAAVFDRTSRLVRQSDPETYHLSLVLRGTAGAVRGEEEVSYRPYDFHSTSSSTPSAFMAGHADGGLLAIGFDVPRARVPLPVDVGHRVMGRPIQGRSGVGALLAGFLIRLARDCGTYRPSDGPHLETVLVDLLAATLAHHVDEPGHLPPETRGHALKLSIQRFILHRLRDLDLTPRTIAAAHHISVSHLHRLFQDEELTVAAWIRHQRLERARQDLTDSAQRTVPIHVLAVRWGFSCHSAFTRAFRDAYGVSPRDYRERSAPPTLRKSPPARGIGDAMSSGCGIPVNDSRAHHRAS